MANKIDRLHQLLPRIFQTKQNKVWPVLIEAIGEQDQYLAELLEEVQKQLFISSASRPYLDRLAANYKVGRPKFIGMDDAAFREYVPTVAYSPKQVKLVIDQLLDLFFFKDSTTAYSQSLGYGPFLIEDGDDLVYSVDEFQKEYITFRSEDFTDPASASADEIVAAINRQAKYSFAVNYSDSISRRNYVRIFSNTIGAKGSVRLVGGRANVSLRFEGFNLEAGNSPNATWELSKTGDLVRMTQVSGDDAGIPYLSVGDIVTVDLYSRRDGQHENKGSFPIEIVDISSRSFCYRDMRAIPGVFTQESDRQVKFFAPVKQVVYARSRRAAAWELSSGQISIEMPTSPPVVKRKLSGSIHLNGTISPLAAIGATELTLEDASKWPSSGTFVLDSTQELITRHDGDKSITVKTLTGRIDPRGTKYTYTSKVGNVLAGVTPALPPRRGPVRAPDRRRPPDRRRVPDPDG